MLNKHHPFITQEVNTDVTTEFLDLRVVKASEYKANVNYRERGTSSL